MPSDAELLQTFIESRSEAAFRELVERHLPLVYATAWRHLGDPHGAQDVAQGVFLLLARKARQLRTHPALAGWLHTSTYHLATKARRADIRRARREQEALAMQTETTAAAIEVERLRPVIDEALVGLKEIDRTAVLLRFFGNRSYAEIGAQLGLAENAARMRVDRALERVRVALHQRGVDSTATAIGLAVAAHAAGAAPATLAANIAMAAVAAPAAGGLAFFMSATFLKNAAVAVVVVAGATGLVLQHREIQRLRAENARLASDAQARNRQPANVAAAAAAAPVAKAEIERLRAQVSQMNASAAASWQERVARLKEVLAQLPEQNTPEISLLTDDDWLDAAKEKLETADEYRRALSRLRNLAAGRFTAMLRPALTKYLAANDGAFPPSVVALQPYLEQKLGPDMLNRYIVAPADLVPNATMGGRQIITQAYVVDPMYDQEYVLGPNGMGTTTFGAGLTQALEQAYKKANGSWPTDPSQLLPFATTDREKAAVRGAIERRHLGQPRPSDDE